MKRSARILLCGEVPVSAASASASASANFILRVTTMQKDGGAW